MIERSKLIRKDVISIIIPVYNVEKYLEKSIKSVVSQTYKNLEIILIDDGSTDKSGEICDFWEKNDSRISVIHQENGGLSAARNSGLRVAAGEYVMFVDSDDYLAPDICHMLIAEMKDDEIDYCACGYSVVTEEYLSMKSCVSNKKSVFVGIDAIREVYLHNNGEINLVMVWGKLYRRRLWETLDFTLDTYYEDLDIMPQLHMNCGKVLFVPYIGYYYLQRNGSISHGSGTDHKRLTDSLTIRDNHIAFFDKAGEEEVSSVIAKKLFDLIISSDCNGWIPESYKAVCAELIKKHWKLAIMNSSIKTKVRYGIYRIAGPVIYKLFVQRMR